MKKYNELQYWSNKFAALNKLEKTIVVVVGLAIYPGLPLLENSQAKACASCNEGINVQQITEAENSLRREVFLKQHGYQLVDPITGEELDNY